MLGDGARGEREGEGVEDKSEREKASE